MSSNTLVVPKERLIEITGEISLPEVAIAQVISEFTAENKQPTDIYLSINSPGGSVMFGMMIVDSMEQAKLRGFKFHCLVGALAASMAFQILAHCDERYALPNANLLFHSVAVSGAGRITPDDARYLAEQLSVANERLDADLLKYLPIDAQNYSYHKGRETMWHPAELNQVLGKEWIHVVDRVEGGVRNLFIFLKLSPFMFMRNDIVSIPSKYMK